MGPFDRILDKVDSLSVWAGKTASWALVLIMIVVPYDVLRRRILHDPTIWGFEITFMLWGAYFVLVAAWAQQSGTQIAVDVLSGRLSNRIKLILELVFYPTLCLFWLTALIIGGWDFVLSSWQTWEHTQTPFAPPLYPLKTTLIIGFVLLWLQCLAKWIRVVGALFRREV
ncbi:MAG: TRAP transporter small permease subunit [Thermodesulfobacteriota bacterium]